MMQVHGNRKTAILFKADSEEDKDSFVQVLNELDIIASVIPVLAFEFINQEVLTQSLQNAPEYSGIIFTSTRAVEAVKKANKCDDLIIEWNKKLNFCVGEATAKHAKSLLNLATTGDITGNSDNLCDLIMSSIKESENPFLFPCSDIRRETIPVTLSKCGIKINELICYKTLCNPSLKTNWENQVSKNGVPDILCFFSPSGVQYSHELIKAHVQVKQPKCVAIGPSTAQALQEVSLKACAVAKKPNPSALYDAVKRIL